MKLVVNEAVNMVINIFLFSLVPWIVYLFQNRTGKGFCKSTGLFFTRVNIKKIVIICGIMYFISLISLFVMMIFDHNMAKASDELKQNGLLWNMIYLVLFGIKTGVSEEILCRGFIGRKLIDKLGFSKGNIAQAFIFCIFHIINLSQLGILRIVHRIINACFVGLVFGYVMEKEAKKSIVPGIIAHASYNVLTSVILTFLV